MQCLSPVTIRNPNFGKVPDAPFCISVPCGKCFACRRRRQNSWAFRLLQEKINKKYSYFLTLTYDNEHLVYGDEYATLSKTDLSGFIKRLRSWCFRHDPLPDKEKKCKKYLSFYGCGEYGDRLSRPHYHICIFTDYISSVDMMQQAFNDCWKKCDPLQNKIGEVNDKSCKYVAKYCMKQIGVEYVGIQPPFALMSRRPSIGIGYLDSSHIKRIKKEKNFVVHDYAGTPYALPRYYKLKIFSSSELAWLSTKNYLESIRVQNFREEMGLVYDPLLSSERMSRIQKRMYQDTLLDLRKQIIYVR